MQVETLRIESGALLLGVLCLNMLSAIFALCFMRLNGEGKRGAPVECSEKAENFVGSLRCCHQNLAENQIEIFL
jgi:hypothetical protein